MPVPLPPKIFQALAPAIKGNVGVAREVRFTVFIKVFTNYFGCTVDKRQGNIVKVSPPQPGDGFWCWHRVPFFVRKPAQGTLGREDMYRLQRTFKDLYNWDQKTFQRGRGRD